jgi:hypothetical protein
MHQIAAGGRAYLDTDMQPAQCEESCERFVSLGRSQAQKLARPGIARVRQLRW